MGKLIQGKVTTAHPKTGAAPSTPHHGASGHTRRDGQQKEQDDNIKPPQDHIANIRAPKDHNNETKAAAATKQAPAVIEQDKHPRASGTAGHPTKGAASGTL